MARARPRTEGALLASRTRLVFCCLQPLLRVYLKSNRRTNFRAFRPTSVSKHESNLICTLFNVPAFWNSVTIKQQFCYCFAKPGLFIFVVLVLFGFVVGLILIVGTMFEAGNLVLENGFQSEKLYVFVHADAKTQEERVGLLRIVWLGDLAGDLVRWIHWRLLWRQCLQRMRQGGATKNRRQKEEQVLWRGVPRVEEEKETPTSSQKYYLFHFLLLLHFGWVCWVELFDHTICLTFFTFFYPLFSLHFLFFIQLLLLVLIFGLTTFGFLICLVSESGSSCSCSDCDISVDNCYEYASRKNSRRKRKSEKAQVDEW